MLKVGDYQTLTLSKYVIYLSIYFVGKFEN